MHHYVGKNLVTTLSNFIDKLVSAGGLDKIGGVRIYHEINIAEESPKRHWHIYDFVKAEEAYGFHEFDDERGFGRKLFENLYTNARTRYRVFTGNETLDVIQREVSNGYKDQDNFLRKIRTNCLSFLRNQSAQFDEKGNPVLRAEVFDPRDSATRSIGILPILDAISEETILPILMEDYMAKLRIANSSRILPLPSGCTISKSR